MLIDLQEAKHDPEAKPQFPSPVVGSVAHDTTPTSANVHLYADPETYPSQRPMLYADCEGMDAGEMDPIAVTFKKRAKTDARRIMNRVSKGRIRKLQWANTDQRRTRQFAVMELYPRVLYTFSDCVVFVLKNAK